MDELINKSIVIFAHARRQLLDDCIKSILNAKGSENWKKVIVWQKGDNEVYKIIEKYQSYFDLIVVLTPQQPTPLGKINQSRLIGTTICFETLNSDYVLGIEDDTLISFDSLIFIDEMYMRYKSNKFFRGVNLGSLESKKTSKLGDYSLLRYGLHGQAGVITRNTWAKLNKKDLLRDICYEGWDARFEIVTKNGFMVTPNLSRALDLGWQDPTHAPSNQDNSHYREMKLSWVGLDQFELPEYVHNQIIHSWRADAIKFKKYQSVLFLIRKFKTVKKTLKLLRNLGLSLPKFRN